MTSIVAHMVREAGVLTEPFIARRVACPVAGYTSEQWSEVGTAPSDIDVVRVRSRFITPGTAGARVFHHIPQVGRLQQAEYGRTAADRSPALIHAHYLTTATLAMRAQTPVVVSAYGFDVGVMRRRPLWRRAYLELARQAASVLVEGPHMRDSVVSLGFPHDRVRVVPITAGHEALAYTTPGPLFGRSPRLLAAGRFVEKKGLGLAIRALAAIRERVPGTTLEIVGSGPLEATLRDEAARTRLDHAVRFTGALDRDAYLARLRAADLFLAPSVTATNGDSEGGAPTTILDAQAVGTIVVASTHADIPFLVRDGETGFLAAEGSVDALIEAIERAIAATGDWPLFGGAARAAVVANHGNARLADGLLAAYEAARTS